MIVYVKKSSEIYKKAINKRRKTSIKSTLLKEIRGQFLSNVYIKEFERMTQKVFIKTLIISQKRTL